MTISLYDVSVKTSLQMLEASIALLQKAKEHFGEDKINELLNYQLTDDMLPLTFQIRSVRHHSLGSLEGMRAGEFSPPPPMDETDINGYLKHLEDARDELKSVSEEEVNALTGKPMFFRMSNKYEVPFLAENFAASFSIPNLMFHATTLYDMLRINGLPIGKVDFLGAMRVGH